MEKGGGEYNYVPGCKRITTAPQSPSSTTVCSAVTMTDPKHQSTASEGNATVGSASTGTDYVRNTS